MNLSKPKSDSMQRSGLETILNLKLKLGELNQQLEEAKRLVIKKDGHIEALENNLRQAQKDHIIELETMKDSFKSELSRMHELWAKSMNDRMDEKIEFHLEQQSEKFERKFEDMDNTSANIETRIDNVDEKIDYVEEKFDKRVDNVQEKFDERVDNVQEKFDKKVNSTEGIIKGNINKIKNTIDKLKKKNVLRLDELESNIFESDGLSPLKKARFNDDPLSKWITPISKHKGRHIRS